jgi:uncharacterized membrane protein YphA (DoxX/SURF4 family)
VLADAHGDLLVAPRSSPATIAGVASFGRVSGTRASDLVVRADPRASLVARIVGATFVPAGVVKFAAYGWELENFRRFGLADPSLWVVAAGLIEIVGGVLLVRRRAVIAAAALLAATMAVAIVVSGIADGDIVPSLTIAPALLVALLFLLRRASRPNAEPDAATADLSG